MHAMGAIAEEDKLDADEARRLCDEALAKNETINFNAGAHAISVSMRYADYVRVEGPEVGIIVTGPVIL